MKSRVQVLIFVCILSLNSCRIPFTEIGCDYFKQNPEEKKKKEILDILSSGHWYLAEYYVDGVDAMDTVRKYRIGEDVWFEGYPTNGLSCVKSVPKNEFNMYFRNCTELKNSVENIEKIVISNDTFLIYSAINNCETEISTFKFVSSSLNSIDFYIGGVFIYALSDTNQIKNKNYIKFPFGGTSYFDVIRKEKMYYESQFTVEELSETKFFVRSKFFGVVYQLIFEKRK